MYYDRTLFLLLATMAVLHAGGFRDRDALKDQGKVWGRLIDHGFSAIMTDESKALIEYLKLINCH